MLLSYLFSCNKIEHEIHVKKEESTIEKLPWHQKLLLKKEIKEKCVNFKEQGYLSVDEAELLNYLVSYRWKNQQRLSIKKCREDIFHVKPNEFFDYQQILAQTSSETIKDWHDLEDLF